MFIVWWSIQALPIYPSPLLLSMLSLPLHTYTKIFLVSDCKLTVAFHLIFPDAKTACDISSSPKIPIHFMYHFAIILYLKLIITPSTKIRIYDPLWTCIWSVSLGGISFLYLKISLLSTSSCVLACTLPACLNTHLLNLYLPLYSHWHFISSPHDFLLGLSW